MRIFKSGQTAFIEYNSAFYQRSVDEWDALINRKGLYKYLESNLEKWERTEQDPGLQYDPPIGRQEIWAAGVTYLRSKVARMEEAREAGGGDFYDRVYDADRPELFFKGTAARTAGPGGTINIRKDSDWDVPEPEMTVFISSEGTIEGYTIGNDACSRSIEGENPLYLPQAKVYDGSAGLGPCIYVTEKPLPPETEIKLEILRNGQIVFQESIQIKKMKRTFRELAEWLYRACTFPYGCFMMTGTGIVPPDDFTLAEGDETRISVDAIGTLVNFVGVR